MTEHFTNLTTETQLLISHKNILFLLDIYRSQTPRSSTSVYIYIFTSFKDEHVCQGRHLLERAQL